MSEETKKDYFDGIEIDTEKAWRIIRSIINMEHNNLNAHSLSDRQMCEQISKKIEEVVKCN